MPFPSEVRFGPLLDCMCSSASWRNQDDFPSNQIWADEIERVLSHLEAHGQFQRYLPNLRGKLTQRYGALAEARVSFFLCRIGFSIISWEPQGDANSLGEFEVQWRSTSPIFVEVKAPTWEGELTETERDKGRKKVGKYKQAEARTLDTIGKVIAAISKAKKQSKFAVGRSNLLVVYTSLMFVSPFELNPQIVVPRVKSALRDYPTLGGVLLFDANYRNLTIDYDSLFIANEAKNCTGSLPKVVVEGFKRRQNAVKRL